MQIKPATIATIISIATSNTTFAQLKTDRVPPGINGPEIYQVGPWHIRCSRDPITDQGRCFAATKLFDSETDKFSGIISMQIRKDKPDNYIVFVALGPAISQNSAQYRIDRHKADDFDRCTSAPPACMIDLLEKMQQFERIINGGKLLSRIGGTLYHADISEGAAALAELKRQLARWE